MKSNTIIKEKYKDYAGKNYNNVIPIKYLFSDNKYKNDYWAAKCPLCYNFFTAQINNIISGRTKSCGCKRVKTGREMGLNNKKKNSFYFPPGEDYVKGFYDNSNNYFIFDLDQYSKVSQHHCTAKKGKYGRTEPVTIINGKTVLLSRFLKNTPKGLECDHINRNPNDNRLCNLRNCTSTQNKYNRKCNEKKQGEVIFDEEKGKYKILFPKELEDTSDWYFDTKDEAEMVLYNLQDKNFADYSCRKSEEIAKANETFLFGKGKYHYIGGALEKIQKLPQKNIFRLILENIERLKLSGKITEENMNMKLFQLVNDYKKWEQEQKQKKNM